MDPRTYVYVVDDVTGYTALFGPLTTPEAQVVTRSAHLAKDVLGSPTTIVTTTATDHHMAFVARLLDDVARTLMPSACQECGTYDDVDWYGPNGETPLCTTCRDRDADPVDPDDAHDRRVDFDLGTL